MNIPQLAYDQFGGTLALYQDIHRYSAAFISNEEIANLTGNSIDTVKQYKSRMRKALADVPADEMTKEALFGYLNIVDEMMDSMMQLYLEQMDDRNVYRNNIKTSDNKRRGVPHVKDIVALQQTILKTQLEKTAVLTKFSVVQGKQALPATKPVSVKSLMSSNTEEILEADFTPEEEMN